MKEKQNATRTVTQIGADRVVKNNGLWQHRLLIGIPTLGVVRIEFDLARRALVVPINWSNGEMIAAHLPESIIAQGYTVADAQNVIVERFIRDKFSWLLLYEDDILPPADAFLKLDQHMRNEEIPIISGLYFSKGEPSWPLVFRGRGNGCYTDFNVGEQVWCDGVPTGFLLIHRSILQWFWVHAPHYQLPDGRKIPRVFETPRRAWYDPEQDRYFAQMGTSDLYFCDQIKQQEVLAKTGWEKLSKKRYPLLCDSSILCGHCSLDGVRYPEGGSQVITPRKARK